MRADKVVIVRSDERPGTTLRMLKKEGYTFIHISSNPDKPGLTYIEGWKIKPDDIGSRPWEPYGEV